MSPWTPSILLLLSFVLLLEPVSSLSVDANMNPDSMMFGNFKIASKHIFLKTKYSFAFVNLRPIVKGHVLISPNRVLPKLADMNDEEYIDLWHTVRKTQKILTKKFGADIDFNVAVQDGRAAGQSVPHAHVHILPRSKGDLERNDDIYDELQEWAPRQDLVSTKARLEVPDDSDRKDRTPDEMASEAAELRDLEKI